MTKRIKKLKVDEVSAVPRPANQHAVIALTKGWESCADCQTEDACKKAGGCMSEAGDEIGKGLTIVAEARDVLLKGMGDDGADVAFEATATAAMGEVQKAAQMFDDIIEGEDERRLLSTMFDKLYSSLWSIANDSEVDNKPAAVAKTVNQFVTYLETKLAKADETDPTASGGHAAGGSSHDKENGEMPDTKNGAPDANLAALTKAHDETKVALAKAEADNKALAERLEKMEAAAEAEAIRKCVDEIAGDAAVDKSALAEVVKSLDEAGRKHLATVMKATQAQAKAGALFGAIGKSDVPEGDGNASRIAKKFAAAGESLRKRVTA